MSPDSVFLAIDQSTASSKVMLCSTDGRVLDQLALTHTQIYPKAGWVEHDAEEIYHNVLKAATELLQRNSDKLDKLLAICITNQRETFVIFDQKTGKPVYNAIVWQCRRGNGFCNQLIANGNEETIHHLTGLKIDTYFPASKLHWLLSNYPDVRSKLKEGTVLFGTIDTYLIYRLTRGKVYATDHTNASRTLFYDIEKLGWSQELCDVFELEFGRLPDIRESSAWFGDTDLGGSLEKRIPICGVMGDSQSALFAQHCFSTGDAKVTFGTGSSLMLNIGHQKRLSDRGSVTALAWVHRGKPTYAFEGITNFTGATIAWMRDQLQLIQDPSESEALARSVEDSDGVYLVPAFVGLGSPYWRSDARAAILGMSPATTRAHVVRAGLESIGYIVTDTLNAMIDETGVELDLIHADGGAVRNTYLMQFVADLNQLKVHAAHSPELSALGAVFNGCLGLEIYSSLDDLSSLQFNFSEYKPSMSSTRAKELFKGWQSAVQQVLYKYE
ncbi:MAG TPA: glycerol kinase [Anaerolineaceae bacterium]|nr:glycerol kinase [Anaerolineaceae bacterium]